MFGMKTRDPLKIFGMIVMIVGIFVILTALPRGVLYPASIAAGPITATKVSEANETRIIGWCNFISIGAWCIFWKRGTQTYHT